MYTQRRKVKDFILIQSDELSSSKASPIDSLPNSGEYSVLTQVTGTFHLHFKIAGLIQLCSHKLEMLSKCEHNQPHIK